jgi:hypothetical protein
MPRFSDDLNDNLRDYAEDAESMGFDELVKQIEDDEDDEMMLALGPRAFGPDYDDEGSNDCDGLFYWDLK